MVELFIKNNSIIDEKLAFFNYGNFGVCPKMVLDKKCELLHEFEKNPYNGFSRMMFEEGEKNVELAAKRLGCNSDSFAFVTNVTTGISALMQSIPITNGDGILVTEWTYGSVVMEAEAHFGGRGGIVRTMKIEPEWLCEDDDTLINHYVDFIKKYPSIKYAILDHIMSPLPVVQPVKKLTQVLREQFGIFVIVDGAHVPGQIKDFQIRDVDADAYMANLHKWYFLPRGCGFLALRNNSSVKVIPPIVSWFHADENLARRFVFLGTQDVTNMMCFSTAVEFIEKLGGLEYIDNRNSSLINKGISYLEAKWNVKAFNFKKCAPFTRLIPLPEGFMKFVDIFRNLVKAPFERKYYAYVEREFGFIATPVFVRNKIYFRLSCQIGQKSEDYEILGEKVLEWLQRWENGDLPEI